MYMTEKTEKRVSRVLPRMIALALVLTLAFAAFAPASYAIMPTRGDLLRFVPVAVSVDMEAVVVYGYFANFNPDCSVSNFRDFGMTVYMDNYMIADGVFGALGDVYIEPEGVQYYTFYFPGRTGLYPGVYICEDDDFAIISCTFDYSELVYKSSGIK